MAHSTEESELKEVQVSKEMSSSPALGRHPTVTFNQHLFQVHNYKRPTFCAHCGNLLVGVIKQGLRCKRCEVDVHEKCQEDLRKPCVEVIVGHHNFREKSYKQLTYCDFCEKLLVGVVNQGLKCTECGANVHEKCQEKIEVSCEQVRKRKSKSGRSIERSKGSRRSVRKEGGRRLDEKTPLKSMGALQEERSAADATPRDYSHLFEPMPETSQGKSLNPSSLPGSPIRSPKQQRSRSLTPAADLQQQVGEVVSIMENNAKSIEERQGKLETLQDNADDLVKKANIFEKKAKDIKKKYWLKNKKMWIGIGVALLILIIVIVIAVVVKTQGTKTAATSTTNSAAKASG